MSRIEELEKRLAADPSSRMFVQLAEEYRKQGLLEQAIDVCEEGLKKHPHYPSARVALGRALLEDESFDRASQEFEAVLAQVPDNILANKFLGETYHRLGRLDDALAKYDVAKSLAPEDTEIDEKIAVVQAERSTPAGAAAEAAASGGGPAEARESPEDRTAVMPSSPGPEADVPPSAATPPGDPVREPASVPPPPDVVDSDEGLAGPKTEETEWEPEAETEPPAFEDDLTPIPLAPVDEPMVLEDRFGAPVTSEPGPSGEEESSDAQPGPEPDVTPLDTGASAEAEGGQEPDSGLGSEPVFEVFEAEPTPVAGAVPGAGAAEAEVREPAPTPGTDRGAEPAPERGPVTAPAPDVVPPPGASEIETPTMAEIYASQGHYDRAISVYRNLLDRDPGESRFLDRIAELEAAASARGASEPPPPLGMTEDQRRRTIEVLEQWLAAIRRSRGR